MPGPSGHSRRRARGFRQHGGSRVSSSNGDPTAGADEPTPRSAVELFQEAQDASSELKQLLGAQPPWSREADAVRQRARIALLAVIFQHPLSPHAQSIDTLWFNTTYSLISEYREVVARIEAALPPPPARRGGGNGGQKQQHMGGGDAAADLRRTLARFRSLLVAEDTFYRSLATRIVGFYRLQDNAGEYLALVGIPVPAVGAEEDPSLAPPLSREESEKKLAIVYKALVYLGDLERYKEQYSEKARREARDGTSPRDTERYTRAVMFYEVARGLQPDNGQAFNQLAVVDGYVGDNFHCTYHYFRALAVRQPFPSGRANLERVLKKAFDRWRARRHAGEGGSNDDASDPALDEADAFKRDLLTILAIHFVKAGTSHLRQLRPELLDRFALCLRNRQLPSETIVKTTAMAIGSHWQTRFDHPTVSETDPNEAAKVSERRRAIEEIALSFLLAIFTVLVSVSASEVEDSLAAQAALQDDSALATDDEPRADEERDGTLALAQRITAVVRRILPSLRILSRWLKSHLEYIARASSSSNPELRATIATFWTEYKRLMLGLARLFPLIQLPGLDEPLEEDLDMRGFLPLRRGHAVSGSGNPEEFNGESPGRQEVHPNEEQLMRISDLLVDVKLLMQTEPAADEARSVSVSTETEDDPVNLAMRATLTEGSSVGDEQQEFEDDDEEVIITPVGAQGSPIAPPPAHTAHELLQNLSLAPAPPVQQPPPLLFGGDLSGSGSIWTMSREESQKGGQRTTQPIAPAPVHPISTLWQYDGPPKEQQQQQQQPPQVNFAHHPMAAWPQQAAQQRPTQYQQPSQPSPPVPPGLTPPGWGQQHMHPQHQHHHHQAPPHLSQQHMQQPQQPQPFGQPQQQPQRPPIAQNMNIWGAPDAGTAGAAYQASRPGPAMWSSSMYQAP
ncbi:uncharacterized protein EHS24_006230 [Apiotrichum porosum]|uniref:Uncharacterized protein n=1 Tax=Apiotrichum porosum TaxID=105984 RepID=A0A427Y0P9_9TREE|nr:uncharacterized protein EHS24_006230 [Apiotrichum porosum]RSH84706.1 hypothetical protein EHS24_006230 [Apiotrichum porosum]